MPTIDDAKRAPPGHFWPPGSQEAQQIAREQRERELARFDQAVQAAAKRLAAAAPIGEQQPEAPQPSNEIQSGAQ
ncbi:hypothetical protein [Bradyrhizobium sp. LTSP849]|uniref:hypothetical protein n=1 Tax=Bradyrhizobium sp. LTSP849 TaxID=1615890 RepID=UPI000AAA1F1C|nr:hypothetical protein [Bradyrhizobium sp. LTSP849]